MSVKNQLAISLRPKRFADLVGQEKVARKLQKMFKHRTPKALMFYGPKGSGKTTIARILALSLQCKHKELGDPCEKCRRRKHSFQIEEINCASVVEEVEKAQKTSAAQALRARLGRTSYELMSGRFRVTIFDEAHDLSGSAQDVLLKYFEDSPPENIFIICSTRPEKIVETLRSRCLIFHIRPLTPEGVKTLVKKGLKASHSELSSSALVDALIDERQYSPRLVLNAVENYIAGDTPEEAAQVEGSTIADAKELIRATVKGDWTAIAKILREAPVSDARRLRNRLVDYLRTVLFDCSEVDDRTSAIANAIGTLSNSNWIEDSNQIALLGSQLATLTKVFKNYPL